jgi:CheY-like chemotaxis protein
MSTHRVLIVEDHEPTRTILGMILRREGWATLAAGTLAEGLDYLEREPRPDCVLLDLDLPDGRGEAVLERVRRDQLPIRVAVCTGSGDRLRWRAVEQYHPDALIQKPIDLGELWSALTD